MSKVKNDTMPHYEMLYIVSNKFTEEEAPAIVEKIGKLLAGFEAKATYSEVWGKKKFTYPIQHENYGWYYLVEFDCPAEKVKAIDREIKLSTDIVRHMIVNKPKLSAEEIRSKKDKEQAVIDRQIKEKQEEMKEAEKEEEKPKAKPKKQLDPKELDEKLDKILDTDDLL